MSEEALLTQEEQEITAKEVRWPELKEEPEVDSAIVAEIEGLIGAQMAGEEPDEPS